ncbi:hypothetical protein BDD43_2906 [Mucilaginibacter gracilis]|uniref:Knr4/Smi1-like domain-containing protein n=1 Tax=Mucilaginibacter gracilis TaxID=423350 RepID=A0A495J250_9SPHI|nr:SMI1/KNR4 family protein [Mucilaginibacter gracilis]RKR82721.1 hypothetical protein BDD43_2906 [Mucilaginibacter gracilis]
MEELKYLLDKFGFVKQPQVDNDFQEIESLIGFHLPEDYKYYLNNYKPFDDSIGKQYVVLYSIDDLFEMNKPGTLDEWYTYTVQIGNNGASEAIGIKFWELNNYKVVIAQYIQNIDDQIEIGTSFTDMLKRLDKEIEWFN